MRDFTDAYTNKITKSDIESFMPKPTKKRPLMWWQHGYSFKNNGEQISVLLEDQTYSPITLEQFCELTEMDLENTRNALKEML